MSSVALVLNTSCPRCRENFPVNAIAPFIRCPKCAQTIPVDAATWKQVLESPALDGPQAEPGKDHVAPVQAAIPFIRNFVRKDAACARCNGPLPMPQALAHGQRGWCICVHCGDKVSVRPLPAAFQGLGGVTHLLGEDFVALSDNGAPHAPVLASTSEIVNCPACGGNLPVDGSSPRAIPCRHCRSQIVIAEAIWAKLHPLPLQRAFYLWSTATAVVQSSGEMDLGWNEICDVVVDDRGNLYFLGGRGEESLFMSEKLCAWSTDASFRLRWARDEIPIKASRMGSKPQFALAPSGFLILWVQGRHGALVLSCADGSTVTSLGGKQPPNVQAHFMDLENCDELACAPDGTLVGLMHDRLLRWTHDAQPIETWPPQKGVFGGEKHQKLKPLFSGEGEKRERIDAEAEYPPRPKEIKDRPLEVRSEYSQMRFGRDGSLYVRRSKEIARIDFTGKIVFQRELPEFSGSEYGRPGVDAQGSSYYLCGVGSDTHGIFRVSPDGKQAHLFVDGAAVGTPIGGDDRLLVLPDGTMMTFDDDAVIRIFAPDGSARFVSPKGREEDAKRARKRAESDE